MLAWLVASHLVLATGALVVGGEVTRQVPQFSPATVNAGKKVVLSLVNLRQRQEGGLILAFIEFANAPLESFPVAVGDSAAASKLKAWWDEGLIAGNVGDFYDNRDGGHSRLKLGQFPQICSITYAKELQDLGLHRGPQMRMLFNQVTIGNASLAVTQGEQWRSMARIGMMNPATGNFQYAQYCSSNLYVYPAHNDFGRKEGDVFPANTPFQVISEGSSGSDRAFLDAVAFTLAAFRPEVKDLLKRTSLLMPTIQAILRRSYDSAGNDGRYLTAAAHPVVFTSAKLNTGTMVDRAHAMTIETIPPFINLKVSQESQHQRNRDFFSSEGQTEELFTTGSAIARVFRSVRSHYEITIDAGGSEDLLKRDLVFTWVVHQGNPDLIEIRSLNEQRSKVSITVQYHTRSDLVSTTGQQSSRVDIAVFADNGVTLSAPAFVSLYFNPNEERIYRSDGQIREIDYSRNQYYVDPTIFPEKSWKDTYHYDDSGTLLGWTRRNIEGTEYFDPDGSPRAEGFPDFEESVQSRRRPKGL